MTYNKPEVVKCADAVDAIQGQMTKGVTPHDNVSGSLISTASAYEADE